MSDEGLTFTGDTDVGESDIDITAKPGDITFQCPICQWRVTLKPEGADLWTQHGTIIPRCRKDNVELIRTVTASRPNVLPEEG